MITGIVILHLLTHEIPVLCCAIYGCYKFLGRKAAASPTWPLPKPPIQRNEHVCCDHEEKTID